MGANGRRCIPKGTDHASKNKSPFAAHALGMISGLARFPLRPMIYFTGWSVMLVFAWQVLLHAS
jgi:hypothetical protein